MEGRLAAQVQHPAAGRVFSVFCSGFLSEEGHAGARAQHAPLLLLEQACMLLLWAAALLQLAHHQLLLLWARQVGITGLPC